MAGKIAASNIQTVLLTAIEDWFISSHDNPERAKWLMAIGRHPLFDPTGWRNRALDPAQLRDKESLNAMVSEMPVAGQSVPLMLTTAHHLRTLGSDPLPFLKRIHKEYPADFWVNLKLGEEMRHSKQFAETLRYFQAAHALRPDAAVAANNIGMALKDMDRYEEALPHFRDALKLDPRANPICFNILSTLVKLNRKPEAVAEMRSANQFMPDDPARVMMLAECLKVSGNYEEATVYYKRLAALESQNIGLLLEVRTILLQMNRGEDARQLWRSVLNTNPADHNTWDGYAELSLSLHREEEYRWACREMLARFGQSKDPQEAERLGRACLLLPASGQELKTAALLIKRTATADRTEVSGWVFPFFHFAQGLLAYRQGRWNDSPALLIGDAAGILKPAPQ